MSYLAASGAQAIKRVLKEKIKTSLADNFDSHHYFRSLTVPGVIIEANKISLVYFYQNIEFQLSLYEFIPNKWVPYYDPIWIQQGELIEKAGAILQKILARSYSNMDPRGIEYTIRKNLIEELTLNA